MSIQEETKVTDSNITIVDYILLFLSVLIPFGIAIWTGFRNKRTMKDFFTASQSMGSLPVAMSLLSTYIGGFMILAYSSEAYAYGLQYSLIYLGSLIGIPLFTYMFLKVFYDLKVATIYEYLEIRYHSSCLRICIMFLELIAKAMSMGLSLCGSCLVLSAVTPVDVHIYIIFIGILCAFYATIGGMRGVIWTDFFMMVVIFTGLFAIIVLGSLQLGPANIWKIASEGERTTIFNFNPSLYQRQNFYLVMIKGFIGYGTLYGMNQLALQRAYSLRSFSEYAGVLKVVMVGYAIMMGLMFGAGLTAYAMYAGCDPLTDGKIKKMDQIIPFLISDKMSHIPGIPGLFLSAMVCAGVSTVSSQMNAFSNLVFSDLLSKISSFNRLSERSSLIFCKAMTLSTALPAIGMAIFISKAQGILVFVNTAFGLTTGPKHGIFFIALLFPMSKLSAVIIGFFTSMGVILWFTIGRILYTPRDPFLPLSTDLCNTTERNATFILEHIRAISLENQTLAPASSGSFYDVSYLCYSWIGPSVCIFVGLCFTYILGKEKVENVPRELISPFVRRFFYKGKKKQDEQQEMNVKL